jgi:hypothetical protein
MASMHPLTSGDHRTATVHGASPDSETAELREENKQLRELVIHLSRLVIRDVVNRS